MRNTMAKMGGLPEERPERERRMKKKSGEKRLATENDGRK